MQNQNRRAVAGSSKRLAEQTELASGVITALAPNITKTFGDLVRELKVSQGVLASTISELTTDGWLTRNHINGRFALSPRAVEMVTAANNRQRGRRQRAA